MAMPLLLRPASRAVRGAVDRLTAGTVLVPGFCNLDFKGVAARVPPSWI
jgi:hypothetical protein